MYNESYDDYIRSILGYPNYNSNYESEYEYDNNFNSRTSELEDFYPEIYKIVYPMVTKVCDNCREPLTRDSIENMTDEIFNSIEANNELTLQENRNTSSNTKEVKASFKEPINKDKKIENRQFRNRNLRDLIQILIIRELLNRPGFPVQRPRPPRPPFPGGGPGRPPFPPNRPGGPNLRPPIMPRQEYNNFW